MSYYPKNKPQTGYWGPTGASSLREGLLAWMPFDDIGATVENRDVISGVRGEQVIGTGGGGSSINGPGIRGNALVMNYAQTTGRGHGNQWVGTKAIGTGIGPWTASIVMQVSALSTSDHLKRLFVLPGFSSILLQYNPFTKQLRLTTGSLVVNVTLSALQHTKITTSVVVLTCIRYAGGFVSINLDDLQISLAAFANAPNLDGTIGIPSNTADKSQTLISGSVHAFYFWNRALELQDLALLARDPYALYRGTQSVRSAAVAALEQISIDPNIKPAISSSINIRSAVSDQGAATVAAVSSNANLTAAISSSGRKTKKSISSKPHMGS